MIILISMSFFVIIVWLQFQKLASLVLLIPSVSVRLVTLSPFDRLWLGQPLTDWWTSTYCREEMQLVKHSHVSINYPPTSLFTFADIVPIQLAWTTLMCLETP